MYEILIEELGRTESDIAICSHAREMHKDFEVAQMHDSYSTVVIDGSENCQAALFRSENGVGAYVWDKLFRRETLSGLEFNTEKKTCEDCLFTLQALERSKRIVRIDLPLYHYRWMETSLSSPQGVDDMMEGLRDLEDVIGWCDEHNPSWARGLKGSYVFLNTKVCETMLRSKSHDDEIYRIVQCNLQENKAYIKNCSLRIRILARCLLHSWALYRIVGGAVWQAKKVYIWGKNIRK